LYGDFLNLYGDGQANSIFTTGMDPNIPERLRGTMAQAGLALLDAWSDGNATPHDRLLPLGEALALGLAET
jgi:hypothetical protein